MQVIRADVAGFCYGVQRAYNLAVQAEGDRVATVGRLIHNSQVLEDLRNQGVETIEEVVGEFEGTLIVRAHGVSDRKKQQLKETSKCLIDGTCPYVMKAHVLAKKLTSDGYQLVIIGDRNHPEIRGIVEDLPSTICVHSMKEASALPRVTKIGAISQTTARREWVQKMEEILSQKCDEFQSEDTICGATTDRQDAARKLASRVDRMIVIGSFDSNNTKKLTEICSEICPTVQVETVKSLDLSAFHEDMTVGITAGASTPEWSIEEVIEKLQEIS